jgi:hypothetical protein
MRNYWLKIAFGAVVIFAIGMVGVTIVRRGVARVNTVVTGSGPINIPLAFLPFELDGERLGTMKRVTLHRAAPRHVTQVNLQIELSDSLVAQGLAGCRLAANLEEEPGEQGINIEGGRFAKGTFWCLQEVDSTEHVEYGQVTFRPGDVIIPLYLERDLVDELQDLDFEEDPDLASNVDSDSVAAAVEAHAESVAAAAEARVDSIMKANQLRRRTLDSLRAEGLRRADSARRAVARMVDSGRAR